MTAVGGNLWGVCGWFGDMRIERPPEFVLSRLAADFSGSIDSSMLFADKTASVLLSAGTPGRELAIDGNLCVALFGYPIWSSADLDAVAKKTTNANAALVAYRRWGRDLLTHLHGAFGLVVLDRERGEALIVTDRLGLQPLCYSLRDGRGVVFATTATAVARHPAVQTEISSQGIFNYLFFYRVPAPGSIFTGISKLLPAQALHVRKGVGETAFYWQMPFADHSCASRRDLKRALFECLRASVKRATTSIEWSRLGTFLSGGLDSSVVTGLINELSPSPVKAFTIGFESAGYDEREYAIAAARHFGVDHHIYEVTPADVLSAVGRIASAYDEPFGNASAVPVYYCAQFAKSHGVDTLLAGDGGDELFAGNASHLQMKVFELYGRLPDRLRRQVIERMAVRLPLARWDAIGRKVRNYVDRANIPMPDRLFSAERGMLRSVADIMEPDRLACIDSEEPVRILREVYERPPRAAFEQRMHQLELQVVLADNDLRKVNRMCALAGVSVRFPLLDEAVCEFSAKLPPDLLLRGLKLRAFFKQAMVGFLPRKTLSKRKHGFGLPVGPWLFPGTTLQEFAYDCLTSLKTRYLLRVKFIDGLMERHSKDPHAVNANPIWDLMMLELWLDSHSNLLRSNVLTLGSNHANFGTPA